MGNDKEEKRKIVKESMKRKKLYRKVKTCNGSKGRE